MIERFCVHVVDLLQLDVIGSENDFAEVAGIIIVAGGTIHGETRDVVGSTYLLNDLAGQREFDLVVCFQSGPGCRLNFCFNVWIAAVDVFGFGRVVGHFESNGGVRVVVLSDGDGDERLFAGGGDAEVFLVTEFE